MEAEGIVSDTSKLCEGGHGWAPGLAAAFEMVLCRNPAIFDVRERSRYISERVVGTEIFKRVQLVISTGCREIVCG